MEKIHFSQVLGNRGIRNSVCLSCKQGSCLREELVLSQHKSGALQIFSLLAWFLISSLVSALCFRLLLLNQFHDVLPGSCIQLVVEDALQYYTGEQGVWLAGPSPVGASPAW